MHVNPWRTGLIDRDRMLDMGGIVAVVQLSEITREPVGIIVGHLVHCKAVNDRNGDAAGGAALTQIALRLRTELHAFDLVYRVDGERFAILLPGADVDEAETIAQTLRAAVGAKRLCDGLSVTLSFGVSASKRGEPFDYRQVEAAAAAALYSAKPDGRKRDCAATHCPIAIDRRPDSTQSRAAARAACTSR